MGYTTSEYFYSFLGNVRGFGLLEVEGETIIMSNAYWMI